MPNSINYIAIAGVPGSISNGVPTLNPKFEALLQKMREMHNKKSQDYANTSNRYANFETAATAAGVDVSAVFRTLIGVKLARLVELQGNGKIPQNESVQDSLLDLAVYSALYASYYWEQM